jgi:hypothetical protein
MACRIADRHTHTPFISALFTYTYPTPTLQHCYYQTAPLVFDMTLSHFCSLLILAICPPKIGILATFPGRPRRRFQQLSHGVNQRHLYKIPVLRISHVLYIPPVIAFWFRNAAPSVVPAVLTA